MPLATGSYIPSGRMAFNRSYVRGIGFSLTGYTITPTPTGYLWTKISDPTEHWIVNIDPRIPPWTSNRYTLDFVIAEFTLYFDGGATFPNQPFTIQWWTRGENASQYLMFFYDSVTFPDFHFFDWEAAPSDYWRPPWWN